MRFMANCYKLLRFFNFLFQFYFGPVELPCGTPESEVAYTKAVKLISDPVLEELEKWKAINWTRSTRTVTPLIVPRTLFYTYISFDRAF